MVRAWVRAAQKEGPSERVAHCHRQAKSLCEFGAMFDDCDNEDEDDWGSTDFVHTLNNGARITVAEVCTQETGGQVGLWQHADGLDC